MNVTVTDHQSSLLFDVAFGLLMLAPAVFFVTFFLPVLIDDRRSSRLSQVTSKSLIRGIVVTLVFLLVSSVLATIDAVKNPDTPGVWVGERFVLEDDLKKAALETYGVTLTSVKAEGSRHERHQTVYALAEYTSTAPKGVRVEELQTVVIDLHEVSPDDDTVYATVSYAHGVDSQLPKLKNAD